MTIARLTGKKGLEDALRAVAYARVKIRDLTYTVIGDGPLGPELRRLARDLGIDDVVKWRGAVEHDKAMTELAACDVFLLPSITGPDGDQEGTPVVLIEAAALGIPAVSTWHSGIPEIVLDGQTGFLASEHDPETLSEKLIDLLNDAPLRARMGSAARRHVAQRFDTERLSDELVNIYRTLQTS